MPNTNSHSASIETKLENEIKALNIPELNTVFDVVAESPALFIEQVAKANGSAEKAQMLYQWAKDEVDQKNAKKRAQQLRHDPMMYGITKLNVPKEATPQPRTASLTAGDIPARADKYVSPSSIQSMFSPGRYLCELYNVAQELHGKESALHIDKRRPDLQKLVLSDKLMQQEVSSLDILLETLQSKIALSDLTQNTGNPADDSFTLPYDDNLTIINAVLESKSTSLRAIAAQLSRSDTLQPLKLTPALVQEQLGLNPASYDLIQTESSLDENSGKRLAHATQLSVNQLKALVDSIRANSDASKEQILASLAEYVRLQRKYALSAEQFAAIVSALSQKNTGDEPSFHQQIFSRADGSITLGAHDELDFTQPQPLVYSALGVTEEELQRIADYCFGVNRIVRMDDKKFSQLYRLATIPRLFGMSFSQAELLFSLSHRPEAIKNLASGKVATILDTINVLENIVQWMSEQKLDLAALNAMITRQYSAAATPELFNFLSNIHHSMDNQTDPVLLKQSLCRSLAAGFHLKTEVVVGLIRWLESNNADFTLEIFSQAITQVFSNKPTLEKLEQKSQLVKQCQELSQYVLIAQWAKLTQQDIELILQPTLFSGTEKPLHPSLSLLILLAKFKIWQQQVKVPVAEALRYLSLLSDNDDNANISALAKIHGWEHQQIENIINSIHRVKSPENFIIANKIYNHISIIKRLNITTKDLSKLKNLVFESDNSKVGLVINDMTESLTHHLK
ncbi:Tc toxin subunit A [Yersinia mollaretii]|uniref:Insecticial toxin complex protein n=1 Tax=Yersinia mollaretii TaxID=33060 RepID=A0AA36LQZ1_YERMO|nr:Tc toxin subunit A [Yersinia mollaretii]CNI42689.1 insecticial toxin complex protein [Yersinia mollaretii]